MTRDEKGRFTADENKVTENEETSYGYYSKVLNKVFEKLEDLKEAEANFKKEELEKKQKAALKKADASKVEAAYKQMNIAREQYANQLNELRKAYNDAVAEAAETYHSAVENLEATVKTAEEEFNNAVDDFRSKNGSDFHMTFKDGDHIVSIQRTGSVPTIQFMDTDDLWHRLYRWFSL